MGPHEPHLAGGTRGGRSPLGLRLPSLVSLGGSGPSGGFSPQVSLVKGGGRLVPYIRKGDGTWTHQRADCPLP
jgi:hypothetical protein